MKFEVVELLAKLFKPEGPQLASTTLSWLRRGRRKAVPEWEPGERMPPRKAEGQAGGGGRLLDPIEGEYADLMLMLGDKDRAIAVADDAYRRKSRSREALLPPEDRKHVERLIERGENERARQMVEAAYASWLRMQGKLLTPVDREYVDLLLQLGETDRAKEFVQEIYERKKGRGTDHLLSPVEREYVELLIRLGDTEKARLFVDGAYQERRGGSEEEPEEIPGL